MKQILQIHAILPGQKPDKQFNIPQRNNSIQQIPSQQQPAAQQQPAQSANGASLEHSERQRILAQEGAQQQPPVQLYEQQHAKQEPQVQQVQQQLASVELNQSTLQTKSNNGYEPISFRPYQPDSAYSPPPAQKQPEQSQMTETNPPSKLLHSNPVPEPTRDDKLRRKDSETQEEDEFHDAHS